MATRPCPVCGSTVARDSTFCAQCGSPIPRARPVPTLGTYVFPRVQVDPVESPYRDARWIQLVVGSCLAAIGALLLITYGLVSSAIAGANCDAASDCSSAVMVYVLLWPGAALLGIGAILVVVALLRTL